MKWPEVLATQSHSTLCSPMDYSPAGSSVHRVLQARILEWVATPFSRVSSSPRDWTWVSCIAGSFFTMWASREASWLALVCTQVQWSPLGIWMKEMKFTACPGPLGSHREPGTIIEWWLTRSQMRLRQELVYSISYMPHIFNSNFPENTSQVPVSL